MRTSHAATEEDKEKLQARSGKGASNLIEVCEALLSCGALFPCGRGNMVEKIAMSLAVLHIVDEFGRVALVARLSIVVSIVVSIVE